MAKATIVLEDKEDGTIGVNWEFHDGYTYKSMAHINAVVMLCCGRAVVEGDDNTRKALSPFVDRYIDQLLSSTSEVKLN